MGANPRLVWAAAAARRVLLGLWVGAVAFFSFWVAPTLFRVIRAAPEDRETEAPNALAGDVVVSLLQQVAWLGLVLGIVCLLLLLLDEERHRMRWRAGALLVALASVLGSMLWLTPTMLDILAQMGTAVDNLAVDHPLRVRFGAMHGASSTLHLGMILGPLVALILESGPPHSAR